MGQRLSNISESEEQLKDFYFGFFFINQQRHFPSQSTYLLPPVITIEIIPSIFMQHQTQLPYKYFLS